MLHDVKFDRRFLFFIIFLMFSCTALSELESEKSVVNMNLSEMFPDAKVRGLAKAAGQGNVQQISKLIDQGVDVNSTGTQGATVLFWSLKESNFSGFSALLQAGANPNVIFAESSAIHWAARHRDLRFLEEILKNDGNPNIIAGLRSETPIFRTISFNKNRIPAMKLLVAYGANVNAQKGTPILGVPAGGITPLMDAVAIRNYVQVLELLNLGADHTIKNEIDETIVDRMKRQKKSSFQSNSKQDLAFREVVEWLADSGVEF